MTARDALGHRFVLALHFSFNTFLMGIQCGYYLRYNASLAFYGRDYVVRVRVAKERVLLVNSPQLPLSPIAATST